MASGSEFPVLASLVQHEVLGHLRAAYRYRSRDQGWTFVEGDAPESIPRQQDVPRPPQTQRRPSSPGHLGLELEQMLGDEHVVINDQPLLGGWYVENP